MADAVDHGLISEPRRRFSFSLRDLMALMFGLAVGLAAARQSWVEWHESVLVAAVCWIMLGLGSQMLDLAAALRHKAGLSAELRWGGGLAIAWRIAAIAILAGYCTIEALQRQGILVLERQESIAVFDVGGQLRTILLYGATIVALLSVPRLAMPRPAKTLFYRGLQIAAWIAATVVCLLVWSGNLARITYWVHIAISGIEASFPSRFANPDIDIDLVARTKRFVIQTALAAALVPLNAWLTGQLARSWPRGPRRRMPIAICLLISFGVTIGYLVWFRLAGLHRFSPSFADNPSTAPSHLWLTAAFVLLLASGAMSYQLVVSASGAKQTAVLDWRRDPRRYYHERRLTMLALSVALGGNIAAALRAGWSFGWEIALEQFSSWPENYIILAAFWLAMFGLLGGWRSSSEAIASGQVAILPKNLGAVWLAAFLTFASSIPLIAWFCLSPWLLLGYRFEWP